MPLYEYRCPECGVKFEKIVARYSAPVPPCPSCGRNRAEKLISVPGGVGVTSDSGAGAACSSAASGACPKAAGFG
jgi:putative FmdB family regulatory protein